MRRLRASAHAVFITAMIFSLRKPLTPLELGVCTEGSKTPTDLYCMLLKGKELWLRGVDLNHRPLGYEPNELPGCSTPQIQYISAFTHGQTTQRCKRRMKFADQGG